MELKTLSAVNDRRAMPNLAVAWATVVASVVEGVRGLSVELKPKQPLLVGSGQGAGLLLADPRVSRRHCTLTLLGAAFAVRDEGSRNGVWIDGSRVKDVVAPRGSIIRVGDTHLVLRGTDAAVAPSAGAGRDRFGALLGASAAMRQVYGQLESAAGSNAPVLLLGETGTGKSWAARAIHEASPRAAAGFETLDCAALAPTLAAAELFGVVKGAYTGAVASRAGAFERAHEGTLFLDEIGELPLDVQAALLRATEANEVQRLGDEKPVPAQVRLIAATCRDLADEVVGGRFRLDLFYRLEVLRIVMPALRSRLEDLPLLCEALLTRAGATAVGPICGANLALLESYAWPGNVRELRNVLERGLAQGGPDTPFTELRLEVFGNPPPLTAPEGKQPFAELKRDVVEHFERTYLQRLLEQFAGNVRRAAREAGIERTHFKRMLRKHGLAARRDADDDEA